MLYTYGEGLAASLVGASDAENIYHLLVTPPNDPDFRQWMYILDKKTGALKQKIELELGFLPEYITYARSKLYGVIMQQDDDNEIP